MTSISNFATIALQNSLGNGRTEYGPFSHISGVVGDVGFRVFSQTFVVDLYPSFPTYPPICSNWPPGGGQLTALFLSSSKCQKYMDTVQLIKPQSWSGTCFVDILRAKGDPEQDGKIHFSSGNTLSILLNELVEAAREKVVWGSPLILLPLHPRWAEEHEDKDKS